MSSITSKERGRSRPRRGTALLRRAILLAAVASAIVVGESVTQPDSVQASTYFMCDKGGGTVYSNGYGGGASCRGPFTTRVVLKRDGVIKDSYWSGDAAWSGHTGNYERWTWKPWTMFCTSKYQIVVHVYSKYLGQYSYWGYYTSGQSVKPPGCW